jgi:membrane protease YdiL (CAAX protease family)
MRTQAVDRSFFERTKAQLPIRQRVFSKAYEIATPIIKLASYTKPLFSNKYAIGVLTGITTRYLELFALNILQRTNILVFERWYPVKKSPLEETYFNAFIGTLVVSFIEEGLFREILQDSINKINKKFSLIFSSLLFGVVHLPLYGKGRYNVLSPNQLKSAITNAIFATISGFSFGYLYNRHGFISPFLAHTTINFWGTLQNGRKFKVF